MIPAPALWRQCYERGCITLMTCLRGVATTILVTVAPTLDDGRESRGSRRSNQCGHTTQSKAWSPYDGRPGSSTGRGPSWLASAVYTPCSYIVCARQAGTAAQSSWGPYAWALNQVVCSPLPPDTSSYPAWIDVSHHDGRTRPCPSRKAMNGCSHRSRTPPSLRVVRNCR